MRAFLSCGLTAMSILAGAAAAAAATPVGSVECSARSGAATPRVVELYTSEGCDSCPPADRWLSGLRGRDDVIALAFHVDYWDRLGWVDRFGSPAHTERQQRLSRAMGSRFVYTPQVLLDGADWRAWSRAPVPAPVPGSAVVEIALERRGDVVEARVAASRGAPALLRAYWATIEHEHASRVTAGENAGTTLRHDHVVHTYREVDAWPSQTPRRLSFTLEAARHPAREVVLVVSDAASLKPVGALKLRC